MFQNCLHAEDLFTIVEADVSIGLQETHFERAGVVLLYHLEIRECKLPEDISANLTYSDYLEGLFSVPLLTEEEPTFSEEQLHHILNVINRTYTPDSENKVKLLISEKVQDSGI